MQLNPAIQNRLNQLGFKRKLSIDIETFSSVDLKKCGLHRYVSAPDFEILLFAYAFDDEPVKCISIATFQDIPVEVMRALTDPEVLKTAWNAQFEFVCIEKFFGITLFQNQWECTMIRAANLSLPMALGTCAIVLKAPFDKDFRGAALIKYFSIPCAPTKVNDYRERNYPHHRPDKWQDFIFYCIRDVEVERSIGGRMERVYFITQTERDAYALDQKINRRGVKVDVELVEAAIKIDAEVKEKALVEARQITGLTNPKSTKQLKDWLNRELDEDYSVEVLPDGSVIEPRPVYNALEDLKKSTVVALLKSTPNSVVKRILQIRQLLSKSSVSKYVAMQNTVGIDGRIRGLFQFYGASRTGRFAGRLVQMQNLPQNKMDGLSMARKIVRTGDTEQVEMMYDQVPDVLSQLIRTAFIAEQGNTLSVADYSAIEACVLAWLCGEKWRVDAINAGQDIYLASASRMFNINLNDLIAAYKAGELWASELRQRGKVAELAFGYGGGVGAATTMDIKKLLKDEEKQPLVDAWREASPNVVQFWKTINNMVLHTIKTGEPTHKAVGFGVAKITVRIDGGQLFIILPSGRRLCYLTPKIGTNRFGSEAIIYKGQDQKTNKWVDIETYGGKLTENIVQAIARDILVEAMIKLDVAGYTIVAHVHDEIIIEHSKNSNYLSDISRIMTSPINWGKGIPLNVKGFTTDYYKKD